MATQKFNFKPAMQSQVDESEVSTILEKLESPKTKSLFDLKLIPRNRIRTNKKNNYPKIEMESLKDSILHFGLLQNLLAVYSNEEDIYILEAGHRRTQALDELIQEFYHYENIEDEKYLLYEKNVKDYEKGYPCKIADSLKDNIIYDTDENNLDQIPDEVIDSEIRLIITNKEFRNISPPVQAQNLLRLEQLYKRKNIGKLKSEKINITKTLSKELGLSETQVKTYQSLNKLVPELREEFETNNITLSDSANYAKLPPEKQQSIVSLLKSESTVLKSSTAVETAIKRTENALKNLETSLENTAIMKTSEIAIHLNQFIDLLQNIKKDKVSD